MTRLQTTVMPQSVLETRLPLVQTTMMPRPVLETRDCIMFHNHKFNRVTSCCGPCAPPPLPPVSHIWDVMLVWRKGNINKNCLYVTVVCTIIMMHKDRPMSRSYRSVDCIGQFDLAWFSSVFQAPLCLQSSRCYIDLFCLHPSLCLLVSWAWWDWP